MAENSFLSDEFYAALRSGPSGLASTLETQVSRRGFAPHRKMVSGIVAYPTEEHEKTQDGFAK
jgi:hypothetical protein